MKASRGRAIAILSALSALAVLIAAAIAGKDFFLEFWRLRQLESPDEETQRLAAEKLGEMRSRRAIRPLLRIHDRKEEKAPWAIGSLIAIGPEGIEALFQEIDRGDRRKKEKLFASLEALEAQAAPALPWLIARLRLASDDEFFSISKVLEKIGEEAVSPLIAALDRPEVLVRRRAADALGSLDCSLAPFSSRLIACLRDPDLVVRTHAALALERQEPAAEVAVPALIASLLEESRCPWWLAHEFLYPDLEYIDEFVPDLRPGVALALGPAPAVFTWGLEIFLAGGVERHLRFRSSLHGTVWTYQEAALPFLIATLEEGDARAREIGAGLLGWLEKAARPALPRLIRSLDDPCDRVRIAAAGALERMGRSAKAAIVPIIPLLKSPNVKVRRAAIEAMAEICTEPDELSPAVYDLTADRDPEVYWKAAKLIHELSLKDTSFVPTLVKDLQSQRVGIRRIALTTFHGMGLRARAAAARLAPLLKDGDRELREAAAFEIFRLGPWAEAAVPELIEAIDDAIDDSNSIIGIAAIETLGALGPRIAKGALPALIRSLKNPWLAVHALDALGGLGSEALPAVPAVFEALEDSALRYAALEALLGMGPGLLPHLREALSHPHPNVRWAAAKALAQGAFGPEARDEIPRLAALLHDPSLEVRAAAAQALGRLGKGSAEAVQALREALEDAAPRARLAAAAALLELGAASGGIAPALAPLLDHERFGPRARELLDRMRIPAKEVKKEPILTDEAPKR